MLTLGLIGCVAGLGIWCIARAFLPATQPLDRALQALSAPHWDETEIGPSGATGQAHRLGGWIMAVTGNDLTEFSADLAVLGRSEEMHLVERIKTGLFWAAVPLMFLAFGAIATGGLIFPPMLVALASVVLLIVGWFLTDGQVRTAAAERRKDFEATLTTYLGLVSILLAGGAGIEQALQDAVDQGEGWAFNVLRQSLTEARIRGTSPWVVMAETGQRLEMDSMSDLASTMELAGSSGAHIRESLMTKANALRNHQISEIEREASGRTTAMAGPTGLMMAGFVCMLLYPAVVAVLAL